MFLSRRPQFQRTARAVVIVCTLVLFACAPEDSPDADRSTSLGSHAILTATTLAEATALAATRGSFIVVDYWSPSCGPCRRFAQAVADSAEMQAALADLVLLKLNVREPEGAREAARENVDQFPTYQLLNASGALIDTWVGYRSPETWIARLHLALDDPVTWEERRARFERDPGVEDALALGKIAYTRDDALGAMTYLRRAQQLDPSAAQAGQASIFLFRAAYRCVGKGELAIAALGEIIEEVLHGPDLTPDDVVEIGTQLLAAIPRVGVDTVRPYLALTSPVMPDSGAARWETGRRRLLVGYTLHVQGDTARAIALKRGWLPAGWQSDPAALNSLTWWCFENRVHTDEAERLAERAVETAVDGPDKANYLDTLAELVNLRGDRAEALRLIERALVLDPGSSYLQGQRQRFGTGSVSG